MTRRRVSNPLALAVLGTLLERPMHPYEMSRTMRECGKEGSIKLNYGSLYSVVDKLEKHGMIDTVETVHEGNRPERTVYRLTREGRAEFEDWLAELLSTPAKEYTQFEAGLSLIAGLPPDDVLNFLRMRKRSLELQMENFEAGHRKLKEYALPRLLNLEWEYVEALTRAELEWVTRLADDIETGALEGLDFWREMHADRDGTATPGEPGTSGTSGSGTGGSGDTDIRPPTRRNPM